MGGVQIIRPVAEIDIDPVDGDETVVWRVMEHRFSSKEEAEATARVYTFRRHMSTHVNAGNKWKAFTEVLANNTDAQFALMEVLDELGVVTEWLSSRIVLPEDISGRRGMPRNPVPKYDWTSAPERALLSGSQDMSGSEADRNFSTYG